MFEVAYKQKKNALDVWYLFVKFALSQFHFNNCFSGMITKLKIYISD